MNELLILSLGLIGCWAVGAINKNSRLGLYLLAALLTGFVGGAVYEKITSKKGDDVVTVSKETVHGFDEFTVLFCNNRTSVKHTITYTNVLSQVHRNSDIQSKAIPTLTRDVVKTGLSPPCIKDSS